MRRIRYLASRPHTISLGGASGGHRPAASPLFQQRQLFLQQGPSMWPARRQPDTRDVMMGGPLVHTSFRRPKSSLVVRIHSQFSPHRPLGVRFSAAGSGPAKTRIRGACASMICILQVPCPLLPGTKPVPFPHSIKINKNNISPSHVLPLTPESQQHSESRWTGPITCCARSKRQARTTISATTSPLADGGDVSTTSNCKLSRNHWYILRRRSPLRSACFGRSAFA